MMLAYSIFALKTYFFLAGLYVGAWVYVPVYANSSRFLRLLLASAAIMLQVDIPISIYMCTISSLTV